MRNSPYAVGTIGFRKPSHVALMRHAIADEFGDGEHLQVVLAAELGKLRNARHGAVVVHDLADDAGGNQSGETREIDRGFGLSGADQHSTFAGAKRKRVAGTREIVRTSGGIDGDFDGLRAIVGGDSGGHAVVRVDGLGEGGAEVGGVLGRHGTQAKVVEPLLGHGETDQAASVLGHEVDGFGRDLFGGHGEIAFIFAVFVVDDHDHATGADLL